jgi:hypothetical protein
MLWVTIHVLILAALLTVLKKKILGRIGATILCYVVIVYGALFDVYVSGAAFFLNPFNSRLYKDFRTQDWILAALTNVVNLAFFLTALWLLIRFARKWSKRIEAPGEPIAPRD